MNSGWKVSFRDGITLLIDEKPSLTLQSPYGKQVLSQCPVAFYPLLQQLVSPGIPYQELVESALKINIPNPLARLIHYLQSLSRSGVILLTVTMKDQQVAIFEPTSSKFQLPRAEQIDEPFRLSRFAYLHRVENDIVLESPLSSGRLIVQDDLLLSIVTQFNCPTTLDDIEKKFPEVSPDEIIGFINLLWSTNFLTSTDSSGELDEDVKPELMTWEFHDLLFHTRSRIGRHHNPVGATYRFYGKTNPPATSKSIDSGKRLALDVPDLDNTDNQGQLFRDVVEQRQSIREFGEQPISLEQLSEFLYRTVRIRDQFNAEVPTPYGPLEMDFVSRPYPSGGGLYELEVYPLVQHCDGLETGLYHYDAAKHQLVSVSPWTTDLQQLIVDAGYSTGTPCDSIQVVLVLTSRFSRVAWKYESIAYALTLKHVGALYQTMYLTATDMGLAPCAMGSGDSDSFAKVISSDYYTETSVGEFLLGSRR